MKIDVLEAGQLSSSIGYEGPQKPVGSSAPVSKKRTLHICRKTLRRIDSHIADLELYKLRTIISIVELVHSGFEFYQEVPSWPGCKQRPKLDLVFEFRFSLAVEHSSAALGLG